jgi:hypothetical protein
MSPTPDSTLTGAKDHLVADLGSSQRTGGTQPGHQLNDMSFKSLKYLVSLAGFEPVLPP